MTRFLTIPARVVNDPERANAEPGQLTLSAAGEDEAAEGPSTFDLLSDGSFVIADPLRRRIVFFDSAGKFRFDLLIHCGAARLRVLPRDALSIVRAQTGQRYIYELGPAGNYQGPRLARAGDSNDDADEGSARLESPNAAVVAAFPGSQAQAVPLHIRFTSPGEDLVSIRRLGADARGRTYVALQTAPPGTRVDVHTRIRKYAGSGEPLVEIKDIPSNSYVQPSDEFRVKNGFVYQLSPQNAEVRINVWDTNTRP